MATAVIGAGNIGKTLTGLLSKAGEPVWRSRRVACQLRSPSSSGGA
jgi:predicted dinucleotide-binding enzyme